MKYPFRKLAVVLPAIALLMAFLIPAAMAEGDGGTAQPTEEAGPTPGEATPAPGETKPPLNEFERKLDSQLLQLVNPEYAPKGPDADGFMITIRGCEKPTVVNVYIKLAQGSSFDVLAPYVDEIKHTDTVRGIAVARMHADDISNIVSLPAVVGVRHVLPPIVREGAAASEGDQMLGTDAFRSDLGRDGTGVKIGIISDGAAHYADAVASGDLPAGVTILRNGYWTKDAQDEDAFITGDEGTAMMEIVHDLAPGAQLYFHDCGESVYDFNEAIDALADAGCTIICDDVCWPDEPFYEDGVVASHVKQLAAEGDILFVSAAGDAASAHYQGDYARPSGKSFYNSKSLYVDFNPGDTITVVLQWNDPFNNSANDYDLLIGEPGKYDFLMSLSSYNTQYGAGYDPLEYFTVTYTGEESKRRQIWIMGWPGAATRNLEIYIYTDNADIDPANIVAFDSIFGHPAVPQVISCGAIDVSDPDWDTIEGYSSQGPVTILGESAKRQKPDVAGPDGVSITGAGGFGTVDHKFFGTSASAPHVAAMAALLWTEFPEFDALQLRSLITGGAHDLGAAGYDGTFGFGRADAQGAYDFGFATVTFNPQGGSEVAPQTFHKYAKAAVPEPPTRATYTFAGWYKESTCKTAWNFDTGVTGNMTLYAKWIYYTASFNPQGGSAVASARVTANTLVTKPADPKRTGYTFAGWFKESSCANEWVFDADTMPAKSITLYAKWNINYYNVIFDSRGGSAVETKEHIAYNSTFPAPLIPSRAHYTFKGWYKDSACRYAWSFSKYRMPAADATGALTLWAKWQAHTFTVSFNSQGGTRVYGKTAGYGSRISAPRSPRRTGYTFAGWYKEPECLNPWVFGTDTIAGKITLYAKWNINHYTVKYDARGGRINGNPTESHTGIPYKSTVSPPETPIRNGYVFGGWYTSTRYSYQWNFASGRVTKSFTLYAKWMPSQYKVTFDTRDKTLSVDYQTVPWNAYAYEPVAPVKDGYLLEGWYTSTRFTSSYKWNFATRHVTGSVTLYARWIRSSYTVAFNTMGGLPTLDAQTVAWGQLADEPDALAKAGYFFGGWYTSKTKFTSSYRWDFNTRTVKSNVTLYARWLKVLSTPKVTAVATADDTVAVTCSAVQYAAGYRFFYTTTPLASETWMQVNSDTPSISVNGLDAGQTYYFKAQAVHEEDGYASAMSSVVTEIPGKPASPAAAAASYNSITVTWDAVPRCSGYEVWRATSSRGTYYRKGYVGDVPVPSFTNTNVYTGKTYYYKVRAYRSVGRTKVYSPYTAVVSAKCSLGVPASFTAKSGTDAKSIKLSWAAVPGVTRYEVWRATADSGVYYRLTTTSYTSYTNNSLRTGQPYYYKVRAYRIVSGRKVYGAFTPVVIATPGTTP